MAVALVADVTSLAVSGIVLAFCARELQSGQRHGAQLRQRGNRITERAHLRIVRHPRAQLQCRQLRQQRNASGHARAGQAWLLATPAASWRAWRACVEVRVGLLGVWLVEPPHAKLLARRVAVVVAVRLAHARVQQHQCAQRAEMRKRRCEMAAHFVVCTPLHVHSKRGQRAQRGQCCERLRRACRAAAELKALQPCQRVAQGGHQGHPRVQRVPAHARAAAQHREAQLGERRRRRHRRRGLQTRIAERCGRGGRQAWRRSWAHDGSAELGQGWQQRGQLVHDRWRSRVDVQCWRCTDGIVAGVEQPGAHSTQAQALRQGRQYSA